MKRKTILKIEDLHINFSVHAGTVQAIRGINLKIREGEIACLVGESGSGKSVTAKAIMGLLPMSNTTIEKGKIIIDGTDVAGFTDREFEAVRGREAAMIFQDPMTSLNPVIKVGDQIKEALVLHHRVRKSTLKDFAANGRVKNKDTFAKISENYLQVRAEIQERIMEFETEYEKKLQNILNDKTLTEEKRNELDKELAREKTNFHLAITKDRAKIKKTLPKEYFEYKAVELLKLVGINEPEAMYKQFPHQLSGGMRQRIVIAIALACEPKLLIADEPTTALDVTIQAQILELIKKLQKKLGFAVLFITHDLGVVANMADYVAVMYAGKIVERGTVDEIFYEPSHPYTWGLLSSMPDLEASDDVELYNIPGTPPNLLNPPKGDAFAVRSEYAMKIDFEQEPPMFKISDTHYAASWLLHEYAPKVEMPIAISKRIERYKKARGEK